MRITMFIQAALSLVVGALAAVRGFGTALDLRLAAALLIVTLIASIVTGLLVVVRRNRSGEQVPTGLYPPGGAPPTSTFTDSHPR